MMYGLFEHKNCLEAAPAALGLGALSTSGSERPNLFGSDTLRASFGPLFSPGCGDRELARLVLVIKGCRLFGRAHQS